MSSSDYTRPSANQHLEKKMLLPLFCRLHDKPVTHVCLQTDCDDRLLCLQCNATHNEEHHKRIYSLNTAMNDNELSLLFDLVESKYSDFAVQIDDKIEELIAASKSEEGGNLQSPRSFGVSSPKSKICTAKIYTRASSSRSKTTFLAKSKTTYCLLPRIT